MRYAVDPVIPKWNSLLSRWAFVCASLCGSWLCCFENDTNGAFGAGNDARDKLCEENMKFYLEAWRWRLVFESASTGCWPFGCGADGMPSPYERPSGAHTALLFLNEHTTCAVPPSFLL